MRIEQEELLFVDSKLSELKLNELQQNYLKILYSEKTIEKTFNYYLSQGWLINFNELYLLIKQLVTTKAIHNLNFYQLFSQADKQKTSNLFSFANKDNMPMLAARINEIKLREKLFFKSLPDNVYSLLIKHAEILTVPMNSLLTRENDKSRDLFYLIQGRAAVYKTQNQKKCKISDIEPGSIFGESGFFVGSPRTADIVTASDCEIIRFKYNDYDFSNLIQSSKAQKNQFRFWELHALMKSTLLRELPYESLMELLNTGHAIKLNSSETLFAENSMGLSFYLVVQGHLRIFQNNKLINQLTQGDLLGEISLFISGGKRTATVMALSETLLIEITKDNFYKILSRNLLLAREIESLAWERVRRDQQRLAG